MVARLADAVRPGGWLVLEEPDFHPVLATDSPTLRAFWEGWLAWSRAQDIDYFVARRIPPLLVEHGMTEVQAWGETNLYQGGSLTARYLESTMSELRTPILESGFVSGTVWDAAMELFGNPRFWSWQNSYVTTVARRPA